jgi:hypothetical protein
MIAGKFGSMESIRSMESFGVALLIGLSYTLSEVIDMYYSKITQGFVEQIFDETGRLITQEFTAEGEVSCAKIVEDVYIPQESLKFYHSFDMWQRS